jgi:hypothetical protein
MTITDPSTYYYSGSGQFYSPQLVRSLSETCQTSTSGPGGPSPSQLAYGPGSQGNGSFGHWYVGEVLDPHFGQFDPGNLPSIGFGNSEASYDIPLGVVAKIAEEWVSFFQWLFGGSDAPPTPRKLLHARHDLYPKILEISKSWIPDEASAAQSEACSDHVCNRSPLQLVSDNVLELDTPTTTPTPTPIPSIHQLWEMGKCSAISDPDLLELYEENGLSYNEAKNLVEHRFLLPEPQQPAGAPPEISGFRCGSD